MTEGAPLPLIFRFMMPLLLGNLVQQTYNMVDAMIVGRLLGSHALASVGASTSVQFFILGLCIGCCAGFAIPVAQSFGADDLPAMRRYIWNALFLTLIITVIVTVTTSLFCHQILHLIRTPEDIYENAYLYLIVIFLGIPFSMLYNLLSSMLRAVGNSKMPFVFLTVSAFLNIFLDLFCVAVLHWGCAGTAIATVTSQALSGTFCLIYILKKVDIIKPRAAERKLSRRAIRTLLSMGLPMGMTYSITAIGSMVMQTANNGLGSVYVSGFTAGAKIKQFLLCPFDALGTAAATFAGQNYGAQRLDRVRTGVRQCILVGFFYGVAAGLVMIFAGSALSRLFLTSGYEDAIAAAAIYLRRMGYFFWVLAVLIIGRSTIQGLGFPGKAVAAGICEMTARTIFSITMVPLFAYTAICFTDQTAWMTAAIYTVIALTRLMKKLDK